MAISNLDSLTDPIAQASIPSHLKTSQASRCVPHYLNEEGQEIKELIATVTESP